MIGGYPEISEIKQAVSSWYGIRPAYMVSARRWREIARPRQVAMYLSRKLTPHSLPTIGKHFGNRDHTTVIHACRQIEKLSLEDPDMAKDVDTLTRELSPTEVGEV